MGAFARAALEKFSAAPSTFESRVGLEDSENEEISVVEEEEETVSEPKRKQPVKAPSRILDRRGVKEYLTTVRQDWQNVVNDFLDTASNDAFSAQRIREHFEKDINNVKNTCMLVTIRNGNVTFAEEYPELQHGRAPSVKYILGKIVREKGMSLAGATFLVMLSDGHRPHVVTFGSARHWKAWKHMVPVPLGNERGWKEGWGTPLDGWDAYVDRNLLSSHGNYSWEEKIEKAVFRGSLTMHSYKLGSCNEENKGACERATKWNEVNRGVVYEKTMEHPELFDVAFVALKRKMQAPKDQFLGAPKTVPPMRFQDYQQYKYLLNVGNNQGKVLSLFALCHDAFVRVLVAISNFADVFNLW